MLNFHTILKLQWKNYHVDVFINLHFGQNTFNTIDMKQFWALDWALHKIHLAPTKLKPSKNVGHKKDHFYQDFY